MLAGMICTKCSPVQVIDDAIADARSVCMREYATSPEVSVYGDKDLNFAYVPSHLHHMIFELVKNSLKATNDKYEDSDEEPPPVKVIVAEGDEDITVKVNNCPALAHLAVGCHPPSLTKPNSSGFSCLQIIFNELNSPVTSGNGFAFDKHLRGRTAHTASQECRVA